MPACWARPASGGCSTCAPTTCAARPPIPTARSTTPPSAAAPAWCSCPSRSSGPSRPSTRPDRCSCSSPGGDRLDQARAQELAASGGFSLLCGRYEGVDQRVRRPLVRRRAVGRRRRAGRRRGGGHGRARGRGSPGAGGDGQRRPPPRRSRSARACSSTRSTRGRPSSGATRSPRCCAPATTAGSLAGATPRPWPAPPAGAPTCSRSAASTPPTAPCSPSSTCSTRSPSTGRSRGLRAGGRG